MVEAVQKTDFFDVYNRKYFIYGIKNLSQAAIHIVLLSSLVDITVIFYITWTIIP